MDYDFLKDILEKICDLSYVILRNYEKYPDKIDPNHEDVDILTDDRKKMVDKLKACKLYANSMNHYYVSLQNKRLILDIREVGDEYYPSLWEKDILATKMEYNGMFIPNEENHYYCLLYHLLIHKKTVGEDYVAFFRDAKEATGPSAYNCKRKKMADVLTKFMLERKYYIGNPEDEDLLLNFDDIPGCIIKTTKKTKYVSHFLIEQMVDELNENVEYVFLYDVQVKKANYISNGETVNILVKSGKERMHSVLEKIGFIKIAHSIFDCGHYAFLYGLERSELWQYKSSESDVFLDISYGLSCDSIMPNVRLPLDKQIQEYMWNNRIYDDETKAWLLNNESMFVLLIVRSVFDYKFFSKEHIEKIELLENNGISGQKVKELLQVVFFKFTDKLLLLLKEKRYNEIIKNYIKFMEY